MKIVRHSIRLRRKQNTKTFPCFHIQISLERERKERCGVLIKEDEHDGREAAVVMRARGKMKVV